MIEFEKFGKIPRYNREIIVTEKIDGTNAHIFITGEECEPAEKSLIIAEKDGLTMYAGSRNRFIFPQSDNFGFALWAQENSGTLFGLGKGRHYGEWWGQGIQRKYGQDSKRFTLFNITLKEACEHRVTCCDTVPVLWSGLASNFDLALCAGELRDLGSTIAPGFMNPEGLIIYHTKARTYSKHTLDGDAMKGSSAGG